MRELRVLTIIGTVIAFCVLATLALVIAMVISPGAVGVGGTHEDWFVYVTPEDLVEHSERIVLARYADEAVYEIPNPSGDYAAIQSHTDVYRRFEVVGILQGQLQTWRHNLRGVERRGIPGPALTPEDDSSYRGWLRLSRKAKSTGCF